LPNEGKQPVNNPIPDNPEVGLPVAVGRITVKPKEEEMKKGEGK
jgi:hypothetical protein